KKNESGKLCKYYFYRASRFFQQLTCGFKVIIFVKKLRKLFQFSYFCGLFFYMEVKDRIIAKSIELFSKSGIRLVTMDQIAAEAGVSKRTIYEMFKDKDDLLLHSMELMSSRYNQELNEIVTSAENAIEALFKIARHGEMKKATVNHLFYEDFKKFYPGIWLRFKKRYGPGSESISYKILQKGINEGIFRKGLDLVIVDTFIHLLMEISHKKEDFPEKTTPEQLVENVIIPYFNGIATKKGQGLIEKYFSFMNNQ
ncbi:MAG: TetR/AcrR family transcriptional regulator, partial [Bacteroidales bacterium]|nr:TetR/AcrR family transcriptional regulator [Bacteroidales bacterium]